MAEILTRLPHINLRRGADRRVGDRREDIVQQRAALCPGHDLEAMQVSLGGLDPWSIIEVRADEAAGYRLLTLVHQ